MMLKNIFLIIICLALTVISCSKPSQAIVPADEATNLYPIAKGGKWGYMDQTGKIRIEPQFDMAMAFSEGVASVYTNKRWVCIDGSGKIISNEYLGTLFPCSEGLVPVTKKFGETEKYGYIDKTGKLIIDFMSDYCLQFSDGLAVAVVNDSCGYIDKAGNWVIKPQFKLAYPFYDGLAAVVFPKSKDGGKSGFIDKEGNIVFKPVYRIAESFSEGLAHVVINPKGTSEQGDKFIDTNGHTAFTLERTVIVVGRFSDGVVRVQADTNKYGFIDKKGKFAVKPQYDMAEDFSEGLAVVQIGEKYGYIDTNGNIVINLTFDNADSFHNGLARVNLDNEMAYINKKGEYIWGPEKTGLKPDKYDQKQ